MSLARFRQVLSHAPELCKLLGKTLQKLAEGMLKGPSLTL
jgi:hypothetical protein